MAILNRREFVPDGTRVRFVNILSSSWLQRYVGRVGTVVGSRPNSDSSQLITVNFDDGSRLDDMFPDRFELIAEAPGYIDTINDEEVKELWY